MENMKFVVVLFCISFVVISALGNASGDETSLIFHKTRESHLQNTRQLIKEFVEKLRASAKRAIEAVGNFAIGIKDEIKLYLEKIHTDRQKLARRILKAIRKVNDRIIEANEVITTCIESHRQEADALIDKTYAGSRACADNRIEEVNKMIDNLAADADVAFDFAKNITEGMRNCSIEDNGSILNVGICLGPLTQAAQTTGATFAADSAISIARINLAIGTLPAAFEMCAGFNMMKASVSTAKIIMEIGSCSATSLIASFI